jgi:hypothetical protein
MEMVAVEPDTVDFSVVTIGSDSTLTVNLVNTNEDSINVTLLLLTQSAFSYGDTSVAIEGGGEAQLEITFTPTEAGNISDSVMVITSTNLALGDTLTIPYPVGTSWLYLNGIGEQPDRVVDAEVRPTGFDIISCYPNPFNGILTIEVNLLQAQDVVLGVHDLQGRAVDIIQQGRLEAGSSVFQWIPEGLAAGIFYVDFNVSGADGIVRVPVVFLK